MAVPSLTPAALAELARTGPVPLIDVRTPAEFEELHVVFARNVPLDQLESGAVAFAGGADLYVMCGSGTRGRMACDRLRAAGVANVVHIDGTPESCAAAGLPVVRGRPAMSLERQVRIAAGSLVLTGVLLGWLVHEGFFGLSAFVGSGLVFAGITDTCGMGMLLARMPWNRRRSKTPATCATTTPPVG